MLHVALYFQNAKHRHFNFRPDTVLLCSTSKAPSPSNQPCLQFNSIGLPENIFGVPLVVVVIVNTTFKLLSCESFSLL